MALQTTFQNTPIEIIYFFSKNTPKNYFQGYFEGGNVKLGLRRKGCPILVTFAVSWNKLLRILNC
jgi:hypothetical protein